MDQWDEEHLEKIGEIDAMFIPIWTIWQDINFDETKPEPVSLEAFLDSWDEMVENLSYLHSEVNETEDE